MKRQLRRLGGTHSGTSLWASWLRGGGRSGEGLRAGLGAGLPCPDLHRSVQGVGASLVCGFSRALLRTSTEKVNWTEAPQNQDAPLAAPEPPSDPGGLRDPAP